MSVAPRNITVIEDSLTSKTAAAGDSAETLSYRQILKSSVMVGGSSAVTIATGIARAKAMAVLLGPSGVGLASMYGSIVDLAVSVAGLGVNNSGVRQIAAAVGTGDSDRIARTVAVLRHTSVVLGVLGAVLVVACSSAIATATFGNNIHHKAVVLLSLAVFFRLVSAGQGALIQGMRRISDLAMIGVIGAFVGTVITVALVYVFKEDGVVPSIVMVAAATMALTWWYTRQISTSAPSLSAIEISRETAALLKLGCIFMCSTVMGFGSAYVVRTIVLRQMGMEATGLYHAAWTLGGMYVGIILQAMGADFYPRLTADAKNTETCSRLVNEQTRAGLLLAGPGIVATIVFAPLVLVAFYGRAFGEAVGLLRWICLGVTMRLISWPMSFVFVARGEQRVFFTTDLAWTVVHIVLAWVGVKVLGSSGAGLAFFGSYIFHVILMYVLLRRMYGFRWSRDTYISGCVLLSSISLAFCAVQVLPPVLGICCGATAVVMTGYYSLRALVPLVYSEAHVPTYLKRVLRIHNRFWYHRKVR